MTHAEPGTLIQVDPGKLIVATNVRKDANLTKEFLASIKQHGVLQPIVVIADTDPDTYRVHMGQRRTLAAVEGGLATIPALVTTEAAAADQQRILEQFTENEHRAPITATERTAVFKELSLFGMPAIQIAKKTGTKIAQVGDAIKVADSPVAAKALETYQDTVQLTIEHALIFTEFEDDEDAIAELTNTLDTRPGSFTHTAQQLRDKRATEAARAAAQDACVATGLTMLSEAPSTYQGNTRPLEKVYSDKLHGTPLTIETALAEAGADLSVYVQEIFSPWGPDGRRAPNTFEVRYAVSNWDNHGWFAYTESTSTTSPGGQLSDEEKAARALQRTNGPLWISATTVRLDWIKALLKRRTLPTDYAALAALHLADFPNGYNPKAVAVAHDLLGVDMVTTTYGQLRNALPEFLLGSPTQAPHVLVAIAAARFETLLDEKKGWLHAHRDFARYLELLSAWGYGLSELEENIVTKYTAEVDAA